MSWIDSSNNMYLFGGFGYSESSSGYLNDLWRFDGTHWTWISGSKDKNQPGHYGIKGDPFNTPGGRYLGITWIDSSNNLYLFGGYGYDEKSYGYLNDLWKFDGSEWTWIAGSNEIKQPGHYGTKGVPNPNNIPGARNSGVSWVDSMDNVYLFGGYGHHSDNYYLSKYSFITNC
jgi:hypothetical protein